MVPFMKMQTVLKRAPMSLRPAVLLALILALLPVSAEAQSSLAQARELYGVCSDLLDANQPCKALEACEKGLAAMDLGNLRSLTDQARKSCVEKAREERRKKRAARSCPDGKERVSGTCCWAGQTLNKQGKCTGVPTRCPSGRQVDAASMSCTEVPCDDGRIRDDEGHCCWDKQVYVAEQSRCIGIPECPSGFEAEGQECVVALPDQDNDGIADDVDQCPTVAEDTDGFEDGDGCPEFDNDGDGVCDAYFTRQLGLADGSFEELTCKGSDGCADSPEDLDGFEDGDGCAELDNDQDGIEDTKDLCPNEGGPPLHNGCPPPPDYTFTILGWSGVGTGVALLATGAGLLISTIDDREQLNNPRFSTERGDIVVNLTESEARELQDTVNTKDLAAGISFGIGGALLAAGVVLLVFDVLGSESDVGFGVAPQDQGATLSIFGRW